MKHTNLKKPIKKIAKLSTKAKKATVVSHKTEFDFMTAALIVSLLINLFVLCLWISLQLTSQYDSALYDFFINR